MARIQYHCHLYRLMLDASPPTRSKLKNSYTVDANLDSNMVIILAALLCALICALGLNSIVRCALRCGGRFSFDEDPERVRSRLSLTGLKKESLSKIPVVAYTSGIGITATECPICLGEFVEGEKVRILPKCKHSFHVKCVDAWLNSHSSCPTCRQLLLFDAPENSPKVEEDVQVRT